MPDKNRTEDLNWDELADTRLQELAMRSAKHCVEVLNCLVERSQIAGLRQIAVHEPLRVADFAKHQKDKNRSDSEKKFWGHVEAHCKYESPQTDTLAALGEKYLPEDKGQPESPQGRRLTQADQQLQNQQKQSRRKWFETIWLPHAVPLFFDYFCIEYLYLKSQRPPAHSDRERRR